MFQPVWNLLGRNKLATSAAVKPLAIIEKPRRPPVQQPIVADTIYAYVTGLARNDRRRLSQEINDRGLGFGDLRIDSALTTSFKLQFPYNQTKDLGVKDLREVLKDIVAEKELVGVTEGDGCLEDEVCLALTDPAPPSLTGMFIQGVANGKPFQRHCFLTARRFNGHPVTIEVFSVEATDVALRLAHRLGLATAPAVYANESEVPLSHIVTRALAWHDTKTDAHYLEVRYRPGFLKNRCYIGGGWHKEYEEEGQAIIVLAAHRYPRKCKLNNILVPDTPVAAPTFYMLQTQEYIREQVRDRNTCQVEDCGRPAVQEVTVTRWEIGDLGGTSSHGSIFPVCDNPDHVSQFTAQGLRSSVRPVEAEVW